jgi:hypothetical protein
MSDKVIVLVRDRDDSKYGEMSVLDDVTKAERLLETLLEAGFQRDRIKVFYGDRMELQVTYKPAVTLASEGSPRQVDAHEPAAGEAADNHAEPLSVSRKDEAQ